MRSFEEAFEDGDCEFCELDPTSCEFCGYCKMDKDLEDDDGREKGDI